MHHIPLCNCLRSLKELTDAAFDYPIIQRVSFYPSNQEYTFLHKRGIQSADRQPCPAEKGRVYWCLHYWVVSGIEPESIRYPQGIHLWHSMQKTKKYQKGYQSADQLFRFFRLPGFLQRHWDCNSIPSLPVKPFVCCFHELSVNY